ncbi:uncharacterized protein BX664DRAFT_294884 [Halteromyces radiatus]|uniref:uncharacterized protein n=1 Tax=Halteromyces radiatus TaxID=101107 RepID=UPI00221FE2FC|nr:uncharacterized protein BX664DRAFT_294884 [Halteromyces radiatus]KAI8093260.1 hypothetical protein BX664DRAFT_294884 [Halteromyces radiatus]
MNYPPTSQQQQQQQQQQQTPVPGYDIHGNPIKIRKKPGRKPNPASPALRKAQNRAAQRAFRERKERHLRDLENTIRTLREQRNSTAKELKKTKNRLETYKTENWYLKGVMLTLQFMCMHHNIDLPPHTPYLAEEVLIEIGKTHPHAIEAYVNAYTRNNVNLKPNLSAHFAHLSNPDDLTDNKENIKEVDNSSTTPHLEPSFDQQEQQQQQQQIHLSSTDSMASPPPLIPPPDEMDHITEKEDQHQLAPILAATSSMGAIQRIRLQLRVQSTLSSISGSHLPSVRLQPTLLQLAIAHDPRIDLIPAPQMRDRMIIFRDQMDYDRCFSMLLNGAVYHGGDPTLSQSWELPPSFHSEYWFLSSRYDLDTTNRWRRMKNLPEIPPGGPDRRWTPPPPSSSYHQPSSPQQQQQQQQSEPISSTYSDGTPSTWPDTTVYSPNDPSNYLISSPPPQQSTASPSSLSSSTQQKHPLYDKVFASPPEMRHPVTSPTLDLMMNMMNSLSTDQANNMNDL